MGKVRTGLAVSLDGFISGPNDDAAAPMGVGGERLLAWYGAGDTEYRPQHNARARHPGLESAVSPAGVLVEPLLNLRRACPGWSC
jgi:hypothetical protein